MRHRVHKKSFNRDTKARRSLLLGVSTAVFIHGEVLTTKTKGKEAARLIESSITRAKKGDLAARRQLHRLYGRRDIVNNLCDRVAPVFRHRQSGFTRLTFVGNRRGDNTPLYRLSLVEVLPISDKPTKKATKALNKKSGSKTSQTNDRSAREAIKADSQAEKKSGRLANLVGQRKTAGKSTAVSGGRGK